MTMISQCCELFNTANKQKKKTSSPIEPDKLALVVHSHEFF